MPQLIPKGAAEEIREQLAQLGQENIAVFLRGCQKGVAGRIGDPWGCPLARYLRQRVHNAVNIRVSKVLVTFCYGREAQLKDEVPLTAGAAAFVIRFDRGEYPFLVRP